jgi:hypothetical protein
VTSTKQYPTYPFTANEARIHDPLVTTLQVAVPLWIERWKHATPQRRADRAVECADMVAAHGDAILYRTKGRPRRLHDETDEGEPGTAEAFNHLAEGIALGAYVPGGITMFGHHWEVPA